MSATSRSSGATIRSQVLVPMIFTSVPSPIPEPIAPRCTSKAPTATGIPALSPSFRAHSSVSVPAASETLCTSPGSVAPIRTSSGSSAERNSSSG